MILKRYCCEQRFQLCLICRKKAFEHQKEPVSDKVIRIGSYVYKYDKIQEYGDKRIITGDEICEWIQRNNVEDVSIFVGDHAF